MAETTVEHRSADEVINTSGGGHWTREQKPVKITGLELVRETASVGELRVYFDTETWNIAEDDLIYTDPGFMLELKDYLKRAGYDPFNIGYSTSGWQTHNYVSLDVGKSFIKSWSK